MESPGSSFNVKVSYSASANKPGGMPDRPRTLQPLAEKCGGPGIPALVKCISQVSELKTPLDDRGVAPQPAAAHQA